MEQEAKTIEQEEEEDRKNREQQEKQKGNTKGKATQVKYGSNPCGAQVLQLVVEKKTKF